MIILSTRIVETQACNFISLIGLFLFIVSFGIGLSLILEGRMISCFFSVLLLLFGIFLIKEGFYVKETYKEHKVLIDEETRFHDVLDRYEILEQDGRIFTVKERK